MPPKIKIQPIPDNIFKLTNTTKNNLKNIQYIQSIINILIYIVPYKYGLDKITYNIQEVQRDLRYVLRSGKLGTELLLGL